MRTIISGIINDLQRGGNMRTIPDDPIRHGRVDLTSNDYLGLAEDQELRHAFFEEMFNPYERRMAMSASASRLLASRQMISSGLEGYIADVYGRSALLFNSGYHANTGMIAALGSLKNVFILADRLVHASIIDGIRLSGAPFARFRHNDIANLVSLAEKAHKEGYRLLIIAESVYSMNGDKADVKALLDVRNAFPGALLYLDEAHAVGVEGRAGLGLGLEAESRANRVDIIVGTFGKALASVGAYAVMDGLLRAFMVNKARSFIFSTALPPVNILWSWHMFSTALQADTRRDHLRENSRKLAAILRPFGGTAEGHIQPLLVRDPHKAVALSGEIQKHGFDVLPIRVPTVPPGTDRLRFSLSAAIEPAALEPLGQILNDSIGK